MGFPSVYELMDDLRGMAESNAVSHRCCALGKPHCAHFLKRLCNGRAPVVKYTLAVKHFTLLLPRMKVNSN